MHFVSCFFFVISCVLDSHALCKKISPSILVKAWRYFLLVEGRPVCIEVGPGVRGLMAGGKKWENEIDNIATRRCLRGNNVLLSIFSWCCLNPLGQEGTWMLISDPLCAPSPWCAVRYKPSSGVLGWDRETQSCFLAILGPFCVIHPESHKKLGPDFLKIHSIEVSEGFSLLCSFGSLCLSSPCLTWIKTLIKCQGLQHSLIGADIFSHGNCKTSPFRN